MGTNDFTVVTYNCHGFNQGRPLLQDLLQSNDIICIQEHWLSSGDMYKLSDLSEDFSVIASFAVDRFSSGGWCSTGSSFWGACNLCKI